MIHRMPRALQKPKVRTPLGDRLAAARLAVKLSQEGLAAKSGLDRLRIQAIESGRQLSLTSRLSAGLTKGFGVDRDTLEGYAAGKVPLEEFLLVQQGKRVSRPDTHRALLNRLARRIGLSQAMVSDLAGDGSVEMDKLPDNLRNAAMGIVHVLGYSLEQAVGAANELLLERGDSGVPAAEWFTAIQLRLSGTKPASGTYYSSGKQKVAAEIKP